MALKINRKQKVVKTEGSGGNAAEETVTVILDAAGATMLHPALSTLQAGEQEIATNPATAAQPKKNTTPATVTVTLPFKSESKAFVEVLLGEKPAWLSKASLLSFEIDDGMVALEMPRSQARRRGLLQAA